MNDANELVVTEAARAINDPPIADGMPDLARLAERYLPRKEQPDNALWRRILNANFRLVKPEHARALIEVIKSKHVSEAMRQEAVACLADWANPSPRDRVIGFWRPLEKREDKIVAKLVEEHLPALLSSTSGKLQTDVTKLVDRLKIKTDEAVFVRWIEDKDRSADARIAALNLLANRKSKDLGKAVQAALASDQPSLRATAREVLCDTQAADAFEELKKAIDVGTTLEKQRPIRALNRVKDDRATKLLGLWFERFASGQVPAELQLDVLEAARARRSTQWSKLSNELAMTPKYEDRMKLYGVTLKGGDAERGRQVFVSHSVAQCIRCHKVDGHGGESGPNLSEWAPKAKGDRTHFLESLLFPSKKLTHGFGVVVVTLRDGRLLSGTIRSEDKQKIVLALTDGQTREIATKDIEERSSGISPMPEMGPVLTMEEIRDVIEFLATLK